MKIKITTRKPEVKVSTKAISPETSIKLPPSRISIKSTRPELKARAWG